jgi:hypothetical protein
MAARRTLQIFLNGALIAMVLAFPAFPCPHGGSETTADSSSPSSEKNRSERDRCKRTDGARAPVKGCPDGGERLPQDKPRSPLDTIPPLSPLVA